MPKFDENVENHLAKIVIDNEYQTSFANHEHDFSDYETYLDLFDSERPEKEYDWMSDISIPEFPSHILTQSSIDVGQYFQTRDFVEVYVQEGGQEAGAAADAEQELQNRTLNQKDIYHYQKFVRAKTINHLLGHVDIECWWEQDIEYDVDESTGEEVAVGVNRDRFNYQVLDPRNVFTSPEYTYSLQQKEYVILRDEVTLWNLYEEKDQNDYFNLDFIRDNVSGDSTEQTETHKNTVEDVESLNRPANLMGARFDRFKRYGKFWIMDDGSPGIDGNGEVLEGAMLDECVMTFVKYAGTKYMIGFYRTPFISTEGTPYRPLIRGLCYIHPSRDGGVGDGKYAREVQKAIDDTFNVSNDRTMLATLPTLKGKKYVTEDTDSIYIEPGHIMELENTDDVQELLIQSDTSGAMMQLQVLFNKMQQVTSIFPTTMGDVPSESTTTATAVAGAEARTNQRTNYKSMTFEYTALTELYWMISQMTYAFAKEETAWKLMGEKMYNFDPTLNYFYKPLSQSIETEHAKGEKIRLWTTILGYIVNLGHPDAPMLVNFILLKIAGLMGDEYETMFTALLNPNKPLQQGKDTETQALGGGASNERGIPQSQTEIAARGV